MPCPGDPGPRPAFIPVANVARLVMKYTIFGGIVENVWYFNHGTPYDAGSLEDLVLATQAAWVARFQALLPADCVLTEITATAQDAVSGDQFTASVGAAGTNSGAAFDTTGNTLVIKFTSGRSGRSYRGRMFWPVLMGAQVNNNYVALLYAGALVTATSDLFEDIKTATGDDHVIVSYQNDCAWRVDGVSTNVIGYSYTDLALDSQRRRLATRGI